MGYKAYSDSDLMSLTKAQIIELLRVAEHNFFAAEEALNNSAKAVMEIVEKYDKAKRLLKAAMEDIVWLNEHTVDGEGRCLIETATDTETCLACPLNINNSHICGWKRQVEALALIGEEETE